MKSLFVMIKHATVLFLFTLCAVSAHADEVIGTVEKLWHCDDGTDDRWFVVELSDGSKSATHTSHTNGGWAAMDRNNFAMVLAAYEAGHPIRIVRKGTSDITKCGQSIGYQINYIMFDRSL